jgi:hypothetical protein
MKLIKKLWIWFAGEKRIFVVNKTVRVLAYTHDEALNMAKALPTNSPLWSWHAKGDTEDLF